MTNDDPDDKLGRTPETGLGHDKAAHVGTLLRRRRSWLACRGFGSGGGRSRAGIAQELFHAMMQQMQREIAGHAQHSRILQQRQLLERQGHERQGGQHHKVRRHHGGLCGG